MTNGCRTAYGIALAIGALLGVATPRVGAAPLDAIGLDSDTVVLAVERSVVSAALIGTSLLSETVNVQPVIVLPAGSPASLDPALDTLGTVTLAAGVGAAFAAAGFNGGDLASRVDALGLVLESTALAYSVKNRLKQLIDRSRPYDRGETDSFPSGHVTMAFAAAATSVVLALEGSASPAMAVAAGVVAIATGVLRVAAGAHYPGDVLAGAAVGTMVGAAVPLFALRVDRATP